MHMEDKRPGIARSALLIVDMQNDFLHPDGGFAHLARENPDAKIDMEFYEAPSRKWCGWQMRFVT